MGACEFVNMGKDAQEVYLSLVEDAVYENGHDSYNGTISTCDSYKIIKLPLRKNVQKFIEYRLRKIHKWECECIELPKAATSKWKASHGFKGKRGKVFVFFGVASC